MRVKPKYDIEYDDELSTSKYLYISNLYLKLIFIWKLNLPWLKCNPILATTILRSIECTEGRDGVLSVRFSCRIIYDWSHSPHESHDVGSFEVFLASFSGGLTPIIFTQYFLLIITSIIRENLIWTSWQSSECCRQRVRAALVNTLMVTCCWEVLAHK